MSKIHLFLGLTFCEHIANSRISIIYDNFSSYQLILYFFLHQRNYITPRSTDIISDLKRTLWRAIGGYAKGQYFSNKVWNTLLKKKGSEMHHQRERVWNKIQKTWFDTLSKPLTWFIFWSTEVACGWIKGGVVAELDVRVLVKRAPEAEMTPGRVIAARDPMFPNGRIPGTATPATTKDSAGWSHFLFFLQIVKSYNMTCPL